MRFLRSLLALIEPVAVFIATILLARGLLDNQWSQALAATFGEQVSVFVFRWVPLVLIALLLDLTLRRRGLGSWGLFLPWRAPLSDWRALFFLLVLGGAPALSLTLIAPPAETDILALDASWRSVLVGSAMALSPVLGQELFVCGYAQTRFADAWNRWVVAFLVAALFGLAHLSHAEAGPLGWVFVGAMALQGLVWSLTRFAGAPLTLLIVAHLSLLAAYEAPLAGLVVIALGAATGISRLGGWTNAVLSPRATMRPTPSHSAQG